MEETKDSSILKNADEKMNEFINKMKNEYDFGDDRYGNDTIIEFDGTDTITVYWWGGFATSTFNIYGENTISMNGHNDCLMEEDLYVIAGFHSEYHIDIRQMLIWYAEEQSRAEDDNDEIEECEFGDDFDALCEALDKALEEGMAKKKK